MKFNTKLTEGTTDPALAELVIFCIDRNITMDDYFEIVDGRMIFSDNLFESRQNTMVELSNNKAITLDYMSEPTRYSVNQELYVSEQKLTNINYANIIRYWKKDFCKIQGKSIGIKAGTACVKAFMQKHPSYTIEQIETCCKAYVKSVNDPKYIVRFNNFLEKESGSDTLIAWLENIGSISKKVSFTKTL